MKALRLKTCLWRVVLAVLVLALFTMPAFAQCSMCRVTLEGGSSAAMARSLNLGIIVLLIPPVAIFCAVFITAYRRAKEPHESSKGIR
jgi:uncharacterized membrane protein